MGVTRLFVILFILSGIFLAFVAMTSREKHTEFLPLYRETTEVIDSASVPGLLIHTREWPVESPKYLIL